MDKTQLGHVTNVTRGSLHPLWSHVIHGADELDPYLESVVSCYKRVFAGPPYFEDYAGQEESYVKPSFRRFADRGILVLFLTADDPRTGPVIGFGGSEPADECEDAVFLAARQSLLETPLHRYLYMAELGVETEFRRQGLGRELVIRRIEEARNGRTRHFTHVIMRTAQDGSNSRRLYERLGAQVVDGLVLYKDGFKTASSARVFLTMSMDARLRPERLRQG
ncbi:MAG: GNAT family N-acetyltransferase [Candidatus Kerfeldbacteria bacterium]|nr:GNAT family N-acetyltransferase [Candidatus Kerfeldbacteria bacterium]